MFTPTLLWLLSPFLSALLIVSSPRLRELVVGRTVLTLALGWLALAALSVDLLGALDVPLWATIVAAACSGFSIWTRPSGGGDGGDDDDDDDDPDWPGPLVDWDRFERDFRRWERERERLGRPAGS